MRYEPETRGGKEKGKVGEQIQKDIVRDGLHPSPLLSPPSHERDEKDESLVTSPPGLQTVYHRYPTQQSPGK